MIRFQCPHCRGIVASEKWEAGAATVCAYCSKDVNMPVERLSAGVVIGDFLLIRKLGEGGMGIVYLAHQLSLDRPAAIKILNTTFSQQTEAVQAFIREARSAAKLNHQNIVQAYAVGEDDGIYYLAMEYIDGKTMKAVLQENKKIAPRRAAEVIMQIAEGLDCAWSEQKLIHHDIKPDNIMQCANERVKLADLGLACVQGEDGNDDSDEVVGTPQYISPEQLTGVATDTRSDIYSLGATFYHLVTGQFPYNGENTDEIARQHVYGSLVPPKEVCPEVPQELNDIIVKMMAKAPADRFQNCRDLADALKKFLDNDGKPAAGGLSGLGGGLSGGKITLGAGSGGGLQSGGGLSGNGGQAKIVIPSGQSKISLKIAGKKEEAKAPETAPEATPAVAPEAVAASASETAPETAPEATSASVPGTNETPKDEKAPKPVIKLAMKKTAAVPADNSAEEKKVQVQNSDNDTLEVIKLGAENKKTDTVASPPAEGKDVRASDSADAEVPEITETQDDPAQEKSETAGRKKSGAAVVIIFAVVLLLLAAGGGGWYYWKYVMNRDSAVPEKIEPAAENPGGVKFVIPEAEEAEKPKEVTLPKTAVYKPEAEVKAPVLSPFMREARSLESLHLSSESSFLQRWKQRAGALKPKTAEEKKFYESLDENYVASDEKLTVETSRSALATAYKKRLADLERKAEYTAFRKRIADAEKKALEFSEASAENYAADLERKMSLLDFAMLTAARTRRAADWQNFQKALALAKNEPKRVADREGFVKTAEKLAKYAERLEFVAEQGKEFTELLEKNKFKGKKIEGRNATATVVASNRNLVTFSVITFPKETAPKPAPKAKKPAPGKGKKAAAKPKPKPKPKPKAKPRPPKPKVHKIALMIKKPEDAAEVKAWIQVIERDMGRSDQYFYYMLYNGYLQHSIASIAPDDFWKKRVDKVMRGYFDRTIFYANTAQLAALKKSFGTWKDFQEALKAFEAKQ